LFINNNCWRVFPKIIKNIDNTFYEWVSFDETGEISSNKFETKNKIENIHLDNCYLVDAIDNTCILENEKYQLIVQPLMNYPYLQLYTPSDRKSIAIENLSGIPNCFNNKIGLQLMKPHQNWELKTSYQFIIKQ